MRGKGFCSSSEACKPVKDHPRLCGEKPNKNQKEWYAAGSPPPMRGKDATEHIVNSGDGITPAYAGKSNEGKKRLFLS